MRIFVYIGVKHTVGIRRTYVLFAYEIAFLDMVSRSAAKRTELFCSLCVFTPVTRTYSPEHVLRKIHDYFFRRYYFHYARNSKPPNFLFRFSPFHQKFAQNTIILRRRIVGLWSFSCMIQHIGFDPTQCACAHDMSNRLIGFQLIIQIV